MIDIPSGETFFDHNTSMKDIKLINSGITERIACIFISRVTRIEIGQYRKIWGIFVSIDYGHKKFFFSEPSVAPSARRGLFEGFEDRSHIYLSLFHKEVAVIKKKGGNKVIGFIKL